MASPYVDIVNAPTLMTRDLPLADPCPVPHEDVQALLLEMSKCRRQSQQYRRHRGVEEKLDAKDNYPDEVEETTKTVLVLTRVSLILALLVETLFTNPTKKLLCPSELLVLAMLL